jgi:hypothetical protein
MRDVSDTAERLKAAKERDEQGIEQDETEGATFEPPEPRAETEPEPTEPEPEPEPEGDEEEEAAGLDAAQANDLEKATAAYFKRVEKVFGAESVPPPCQHCGGLGFDLTGGAGEPDYAEHENYIECGDCRGFGHVKTGSKVPGHDLHDCPNCLGRGYLEKLPTPQLVPTEQPTHGTPAWMGDVQTSSPLT